MTHALLLLMRLQARGLFRRIFRQARTPRGAVLFLVGVAVFSMWLLFSVSASDERHKPSPASARAVVPLFILGVTLLTTFTSAGEKAIAFTGGEVDFLFPGPFSRRQLLVYKLTKSISIAGLTSLIISVAILQNASYWIAAYIGCFLTLVFVQLSSTAVLLIAQHAGQRMASRGRWIFLLAIGVLLLFAARSAVGPEGWDALMTDPQAVLRQASATTPGRIVLAPFDVLAQVITAEHPLTDLPKWGGIALAINATLVVIIVQLDSQFVEVAAGASHRRSERLRRFRSGGGMGFGARATARRSLPAPTAFGGAGIIAWRQLTHAIRASRSLLIVLLVLALSVGPILMASARVKDPTSVMAPVFASLAWMSVLLASVLRFDFRADLDAIETLKTLPMRPVAVATGQVIAPALILTLIHWIVIVAALSAYSGMAAGQALRAPLAVAAFVALPFNLLMFAAENLIFLLSPSRPAAAGPGDFSVLGKQIFTLAIRTFGVGIGAGIAAVAGVLAYYITNHSLIAMALASGLVLSIEAVAMLPLVGLAFRRFDPSVHMPG